MTGKNKSRAPRISARALRQFAENRRIANKAVAGAVEENRRMGLAGSSGNDACTKGSD